MKNLPPHTKEKMALAALIVFFVALAFVNIGDTKEFRPDDESLYVCIAKDMYEHGELWIPTWFGEKAFYKPPLTYWISMAAFAVNGISIAAARIPIALLTLATVFLTFLMAKEWFGRREGILAAALTGTSLGFIIYGRIAMMDLPLCFFTTLGVFFFHRASRSPAWIVAFFGVAGISTLIKGPISFIILMVIATGYCAMTGKWRLLVNRWTWLGIVCAGGGILLWPTAMALKGSLSEWYSFFIVRENFGKFHEHIKYSGVLIVAYFMMYLLPWSPLLPASLWDIFRRRLYKKEEIALPLLWMLAVVLIHILPATKLKHYVIPAIPPAAVLIAACATSGDMVMKIGKVILQILLAITGLALAALLGIMAGWVYLVLLAMAILLILISIAATHKDCTACVISFGCAAILLIPAISTLTFYRLPESALSGLREQDVAVVRLQTYVYSYDINRYTPQITSAVEFNDCLAAGRKIIISDTDLKEFSSIDGYALVPFRITCSWSQWKKKMPPGTILSVLRKGDPGELIENMNVVEKSNADAEI